MLGNYLKIAIRNIRRHKTYAFINIAGLAIGMACCILIIMYIITELSYDKFHNNSQRIYRLASDAKVGGMVAQIALTNAPAGSALVQAYPEVENSVRIRPRPKISVKHEEKQFYEEGILWADSSIFDIFTFPMIQGDPQTSLKAPYSLVITEEIAQKYFKDGDPLGRILRFNDQADYTVTGVVKNVPPNSHFSFDMLCSYETQVSQNREFMEDWFNFNLYTYLLLSENLDYRELEEKFPALVEKHMGSLLKSLGGEINYFLQPLTRIHLHSNLENEISGNSSIVYVYVFAAIALFILFIACINFMNLSTARSATRAKEVAMRKVIGAERKELISQFFGESLVYCFVSLLIALVLVHVSLPLFSSISGRGLKIDYAEMPWLILGFIGLVFFVGLIAGSYPALFLSAFQPATVLKGSMKAGTANSRFRSILVVAQFVISISLIIGTGIILSQLKYMKSRNLGFDKKNVLIVQIQDREILQSIETIKTELKRISGVLHVGVSSAAPGQITDVNAFVPEGFTEKQTQLMESIYVGQDFLPTLGIELTQGRNFSSEFGTDRTDAVIINETAVKKFGWDEPIGKTIKTTSSASAEELKWDTKKIIGVIKDFHMSSLHKTIMPLCIRNRADYTDTILIKIGPENMAGTLAMLKEKWREIDPNRPLDYFFLEGSFDNQYRAEEKLNDIFASFTVFAIFIACLGLFGMASFIAEQRTKEIGIRKVLGASVSGIVVLLSKNFVKLILAANLIAWPIAYLSMNNWLQSFAYRRGIGIWIFILTGVLSLGIALITVSYQSIKVAISNPLDALKYE